MTAHALPPGPRLAPLQTLRFVRDVNSTLTDAIRRYGDPFLLPLLVGDMVITAHPEGIKEIFTADPDVFASFGSGPLEPLVGKNSLLLLSGPRHKRERKLLMPPFHGERMRAYGQIMQQTTHQRLTAYRPGDRVVMQELTQTVAFDIILRAVFGVEDAAHSQQFHRNNDRVMGAVDPLYMFFPPLRQPFMPAWRRLLDAQAEQDTLLQAQLDNRRASGKSGEDILSLMMAARDEADQPMSDRELKDELITMIAAGHETTALSMAWSMFWLHRDPPRLARLQAEIDALGPNPDPAALAKLPYLSAVCDETLRLRPVVDICPRRTVQPFRLRGWDLPVGTAVAASITLAHRNPDVYPQPDAFMPERFLEHKFSPFEYLPFGGGARRCLGAAFAAYEMRIVLGTLLSEGRFSLTSTTIPRQVRRNVTSGPAGGIPMIFTGPRGPAAGGGQRD